MKLKYDFDETNCPNCSGIAKAEFVDIGVGNQQCSPFACEACGWVQKQDNTQFIEDES